MADKAIAFAAESAVQHVKTKSTFKRRSVRGLKDSTKTRVIRTAGGKLLRLSWPKEYASHVEYGTREHFIFPKRAPWLLIFFWEKIGQWVSLTRVRHPGTKPYWFGRDAQHEGHRQLGWKLAEGMRQIARRF